MVFLTVQDRLCSSFVEIFKGNTKVGMNEIQTEMPVCLSTRTAEKG